MVHELGSDRVPIVDGCGGEIYNCDVVRTLNVEGYVETINGGSAYLRGLKQ